MRAAAVRLAAGTPEPADAYHWEPHRLLADAGMPPDPWQRALLEGRPNRALLLCSRQSGKSQVAAAIALQVALLEPDSLVLLLSPTLRQSGELFRDKLVRLYNGLGRPVATEQETALSMTLANGSRILALPGSEGGLVGFSRVALLVIDEAARVADSLYRSVRPMLAVSGGRLAALSTPLGKRGWFYEEWSGGNRWERVEVAADRCPRISPEFLAEERVALGERWYRQEYLCSFEETVDAVFASEDIEAMIRGGEAAPLFGDGGC